MTTIDKIKLSLHILPRQTDKIVKSLTHGYDLIADVDAAILVHGAVFSDALDENAGGL